MLLTKLALVMGLFQQLVRYCLVLLLVVLLVGTFEPRGFEAEAKNTSVEKLVQKKRSNQQQLKRIKRIKQQIILQERFVTSNILKNQRRLESSKTSMETQQEQLEHTKYQLSTLEDALDVALADQQKLAVQVGRRLRSLYMGERMSFLHMLLDSGNLSTLLDRMYYKKMIFAQDKRLYAEYILKTQILEEKKNELAQEKNHLASTISRIQSYQSQLQESVAIDRLLVEKLKTSREAYEMAENQLEQQSYSIERQIMAMTRRGGVVMGSTGRFIRPIIAAITSGFGYRVHPLFHTRRLHTGIDFGAGYGTPIRAADGGQIIQSGWQGGYGKVVIINHGSQGGRNLTTLYGHMSNTAVRIGQQVAKGQVIGYVGSTGFSTGAHLHFEVRQNGRPVNPLSHL